jgi:hypothetical protein
MRFFLIASLALVSFCGEARARGDQGRRTWPDKFMTPGATNPKVTQANIKRTICKAGWTKTIRPPSSYPRSDLRVSVRLFPGHDG